MSRIGRKWIKLPEAVKVDIKDGLLTVNGPKGQLDVSIPEKISVKLQDQDIVVERSSDDKKVKSSHGLVRSLIANSVEGVNSGFSKTLEITGTGYKADLSGKSKLKLSLGYSNPIDFDLPDGVDASVEERGTRLTVQGIDKQLVGEVAAKIRKLRQPDAYKGKGVRYSGERVRLKAGKSGAKK